MEYLFFNYYLINRIIDDLDEQIKSKLNYDKSDLLSYISFKYAPKHYSKRDKYDLYNKFNSSLFNDLIVESLILLSKDNDFDNLLFSYGLIISDSSFKLLKDVEISESNIDNYIKEKYKLNFDYEYYKENHKKILIYNEKMDNLVHNPLIRTYNFFGSYYYFLRAYKKAKKAFKIRSKITTLENIYNFDNIDYKNKKINNIDDYIEYIYDIIKTKIDAVNEYLFEQKDKKIRIEFNIDKEKKI